MNLNEKLGLKEELLKGLIDIFKKYNNIEKVVIFGSRATGDYKYNSDIDICIFGEEVTQRDITMIKYEIDEIYTPISIDVVVFKSLSKTELIDNILKDGVVIYDRKKDA